MLAGHSIADAARRSGWNSLPLARWAVVSSRAVQHVLAFRPYVGKSTPQLIRDSLVVADREESPGKEKKSRDESRLSRLDSLRHSIALRRSPKPGAFTAQALSVP